MDNFEKVGYLCLGVVALCYLVVLFYGIVAAFPVGLIGLIALLGIGVLLITVTAPLRLKIPPPLPSPAVPKVLEPRLARLPDRVELMISSVPEPPMAPPAVPEPSASLLLKVASTLMPVSSSNFFIRSSLA